MAETKENNQTKEQERFEKTEQENRTYMKNGVTYLGFSRELQPYIVDQMLKGVPEFQAKERKYYNDQDFDYALKYQKSEREGPKFYTWPGYTVTAADDPERAMFVPVFKNKGFTSKESANLLCGLSVYKEHKNAAGVSNSYWTELDFSLKDEDGQFVKNRYYENHGYDLDKGLSELSKKTENGVFPNWIAHALRKGNRPDVIFIEGGEEINCFLVANPKDRTIDVYQVRGELLMRQDATSEYIKEKVERQAAKRPEHHSQKAFIQKLLEKKFSAGMVAQENAVKETTGKASIKSPAEAPKKRIPRKTAPVVSGKRKTGISR